VNVLVLAAIVVLQLPWLVRAGLNYSIVALAIWLLPMPWNLFTIIAYDLFIQWADRQLDK